ncbi:828_t:CDS:1, partial [Rhizophagus irregularis]
LYGFLDYARRLMIQFGIKTEIEVTSWGRIVNIITKVYKKKLRDVTKSVMEAVIPIKRHYRKLFKQEFLLRPIVESMETNGFIRTL